MADWVEVHTDNCTFATDEIAACVDTCRAARPFGGQSTLMLRQQRVPPPATAPCNAAVVEMVSRGC
eukprot:m.329305 g.329305  ORF g.329305 m.329305 type:complete len:66 (+) comp16505_c0_seq2:1308-1505(+)